MRYYEFAKKLNEDLSEDSLRSLISIVNFERARIDSEGVTTKISPSKLITMMQNIGYESFNFRDLLSAYNDSTELQSLISRPEKNQMLDILPEQPAGTDLSAMPTDMAQPEQPDMQQPLGAEVDTGIPGEQPELGQIEEPPISSEPSGPIESPQGTEKTVQSMAKKALKRRQ